MKNNKGQLAIFVVVAIVIIAGIIAFFIFRGRIISAEVPVVFQPAYNSYISCLQGIVNEADLLVSAGGGYIKNPEFEPGSNYAPFSSQLDFFGQGVQYWYYVSANGVVKEKVPSINFIEVEIAKYIEEEAYRCDIKEIEEQGYSLFLGEAIADVTLENKEINAVIRQELVISKEGEDKTIVLNKHNIKVNSNLRENYEIAKEIYEYEKQDKFLEDYAKDVLYLYAPVSGAEIICEPLVWNAYDVFDNLSLGLQANIPKLKIKGDYYDVTKEGEYYVLDKSMNLGDKQVNFLYDDSWPRRFEVWPTKSDLLIAEPKGTELSLFNFCYASYNFVYDMYFPVLIQIYDEDELFQFPIAVVINKNLAEEIEIGESLENMTDICENTNTDLIIYTYNNELEAVEADVEFKCLGSSCSLGKTEILNGEAVLKTRVPACINAEIIAKSEGYSDTIKIVSTNEQSVTDILLDKEYELKVELYIDNQLYNGQAMLSFSAFNDSIFKTIIYPQENTIILSEAQYNIDAYILREGSINIPAKVVTECTTVQEGLPGLFGFQKEKCFDVEMPSQTITNVLYAGGSTNYYASESELKEDDILRIYTSSFPIPQDIADLQRNFELFDSGDIYVEIV